MVTPSGREGTSRSPVEGKFTTGRPLCLFVVTVSGEDEVWVGSLLTETRLKIWKEEDQISGSDSIKAIKHASACYVEI